MRVAAIVTSVRAGSATRLFLFKPGPFAPASLKLAEIGGAIPRVRSLMVLASDLDSRLRLPRARGLVHVALRSRPRGPARNRLRRARQGSRRGPAGRAPR